MTDPPSVLFVCVHNAGRSQMAAALLTRLSEGRIEVRSAGTEPADRINPVAVVAMAELGIDLTSATPKALTPQAVQTSDVVITMAAATRARTSPGCPTATGNSKTPPASPSTSCGRSATTSPHVFVH